MEDTEHVQINLMLHMAKRMETNSSAIHQPNTKPDGVVR